MAHKTRINGTNYGIKGGKCRVNGTNYSIKKGRTLVGGTGYNIAFDSGFSFIVIFPHVEGFNIYAYQTENIIVTAPPGMTWAEIANAPSLNSYKTASGQTLKLVVSSADYPGVSIFASDGSAASFYHMNKYSSFVPQNGEQIDLSLLGGYASIDFDWSKWTIADL